MKKIAAFWKALTLFLSIRFEYLPFDSNSVLVLKAVNGLKSSQKNSTIGTGVNSQRSRIDEVDGKEEMKRWKRLLGSARLCNCTDENESVSDSCGETLIVRV